MNLSARAMQMYGPYMHDRGGWNHPWLAVLLFVIVGAAIGLLVWALLRGGTRHPYGAPPAYPAAPPAGDPALEVLRMRFARGEIDADEYASRVALLHGAPPAGPPPA